MVPVQQAIETLATLPPWLIHVIVGAGAALEAFLPPVPADVFVVAGGVLAAHGAVRPGTLFLVTWLSNSAAASAIYYIARQFGARFFKLPAARWLLKAHQLEAMARFYRRWGVPAIFGGRFVPGWRAIVPVFAGFARMPASRALPTLIVASGLWHAGLVRIGVLAGDNLDLIAGHMAGAGRVLLWIALVGTALFLVWWWRTIHPGTPA
jgi:membrane protein DedA with SNARE-associated domain